MKAHLRDSDTPLIEGQDQVAKCGQHVLRAVFAFLWDQETFGTGDWGVGALRHRGICGQCLTATEERPSKNARYIYGIVNGEESRHSQEGG